MGSYNVKSATFDVQDVLKDKASAVRAVYRKWGNRLVNMIKAEIPIDRGMLYNSISYQINSPKSKVDILDRISLNVGSFNSPSALRYIKYVMEPTVAHFVPMKTAGGKYTGILGWMQRHSIVLKLPNKHGKNTTWRWAKGKNEGRIFNGFQKEFSFGTHTFERIRDRYDYEIQQEVDRVLRSGLNV